MCLFLRHSYHVSEFKAQCAAIRRGLATVVPHTLLSLFTHEELGEPGLPNVLYT